MKYLIIAIGLVVLLGILAVFKLLRGRLRGESPYEAKGNLLTPAELKFLGVLDQVIGSHYRIMAQVRLADLIKVKKGLDNSTRTSEFNPSNHDCQYHNTADMVNDRSKYITNHYRLRSLISIPRSHKYW